MSAISQYSRPRMNEPTPSETQSPLELLLAEREIRRVMLKYFRANDRLQLDEVASAYHADAYDDHGTYKGDVKGLIEWIRDRHQTIEQSMHLAGNPLIEIDGARAAVETYCTLVQHERTGCVNLATRRPAYRRFVFGLRYVDRFENRRGEWKIAHRVVVWEWSQEDVGDLTMDPTWVTAQRSREDRVYQNQ
jgi:SnoaL-like domain